MTINIGPFFCAAAGELAGGTITSLNVCVEWAGAHSAERLPLFQAHPNGTAKVRLHHIVVRADQIPCDVVCPEHQILEAPGGTYLPLEAVLVALYRKHAVLRNIREVLRELGEFVSLQNSIRDHVAKDGLLLPTLEKSGFRIVNVLREGDEVLAEIGWSPTGSSNIFHTANCMFKVQAGAVTEDCWIKSVGETGVAGLLAQELHTAFPGQPRELITSSCLEYLALTLPS